MTDGRLEAKPETKPKAVNVYVITEANKMEKNEKKAF